MRKTVPDFLAAGSSCTGAKMTSPEWPTDSSRGLQTSAVLAILGLALMSTGFLTESPVRPPRPTASPPATTPAMASSRRPASPLRHRRAVIGQAAPASTKPSGPATVRCGGFAEPAKGVSTSPSNRRPKPAGPSQVPRKYCDPLDRCLRCSEAVEDHDAVRREWPDPGAGCKP